MLSNIETINKQKSLRVVKKKNVSVDFDAPRVSNSSILPQRSQIKNKWTIEEIDEEY